MRSYFLRTCTPTRCTLLTALIASTPIALLHLPFILSFPCTVLHCTVLREVQRQSYDHLSNSWQTLDPETLCSMINDNQVHHSHSLIHPSIHHPYPCSAPYPNACPLPYPYTNPGSHRTIPLALLPVKSSHTCIDLIDFDLLSMFVMQRHDSIMTSPISIPKQQI